MYCTVEATCNYREARSIARPLCDHKLVVFLITMRCLLYTVTSSTAEAHKSGSVVPMMARVYGGRLIDTPLWLGLTLLAGIVFAAVVVVYVRRQTIKLLRHWTCHVAASCFCCCCRQFIPARHAASGDANAFSNDVGKHHRHVVLRNVYCSVSQLVALLGSVTSKVR